MNSDHYYSNSTCLSYPIWLTSSGSPIRMHLISNKTDSRLIRFPLDLWQKYRLHTRRPTQNVQTNGNSQAPQFVVVGGIWVPPQEYATITAATAPASGEGCNGIYAPVPVAALPTPAKERPQQTQSHRMQSEERGCSHSEGRVHSSSPSTSSSTHTTTASPVF